MPDAFWEQIATGNGDALRSLPAESRAVALVSTSDELHSDAEAILSECIRILQFDGLLFVYGQPRHVPSWGERLARIVDGECRMVFKYWIAIELNDTPGGNFLKPSHRGLLMFLKQPASRKSSAAPPLNTAVVRVPHQYCVACRKTLKDWGGKKHLMNPNGAALSDVWRDLPKTRLKNHIAPETVLERVRALTEREGARGLHIVQIASDHRTSTQLVANQIRRDELHESLTAENRRDELYESLVASANSRQGHSLKPDQVVLGDCVEFLNKIAAQHPAGVFDLAFADPPYNLAKKYEAYTDELADQHYLDWCNQWLGGMVRTLKPGGSLFVLNLPKWAIHHAKFLNERLEFRHWIAWDALSDPRGKLMPAHYALLYYIHPGAPPVFNYSRIGIKPNPDFVLPPDAPKYCLRAACVRDRKALGDDDKVELSDVWFDVHRIKHKRDRDAHPCQLPEKLMERIIKLTTNPGALVFDPFCGAGTTAIAARKLGRHFITTESDPKYVRITNAKLAAMKEHADLFGEFVVPRTSTRKEKSFITKKAIETFLQSLALKLGRVPTEQEIHQADGEMLAAIDRMYPNRGAALKRCKVALA